jgi:hydrogenase nickel incorporation protein HypA/HybF
MPMREFSLTRKLLETALEHSGSKRIVRIDLLIGPFSEEREEAIQFYWRDLAKGTPGEGAELHFERTPVEMKCLDCSGTFYLDETGKDNVCRYCHSKDLQLLTGMDVKLEGIQVE